MKIRVQSEIVGDEGVGGRQVLREQGREEGRERERDEEGGREFVRKA